MKSSHLETFLLGVTFGIGITLLSLYTQKPAFLVASVDTLAERGQKRKAREEEDQLRRERLKEAGFLDEEIDKIFT